MSQTFTAAAIAFFREQTNMPHQVAKGFREDLDDEQRLLRFACKLADQFERSFGIDPDDAEPGDALTAMLRDVVRIAGVRVDWCKVARALEKEFTTPIRLTLPATCPGRLAAGLVTWRGPVN